MHPAQLVRNMLLTSSRAVTDLLRKQDYSGWIGVEAKQDPAKAPPGGYARMGYEHIVRICHQSGLMINALSTIREKK